ncbi:hypothetical protein HDU96_007743 [Phlyctochytrium bullatum]|nr:hypothetical protein HDU96_007743 [Phlyctochytrium bullatum]
MQGAGPTSSLTNPLVIQLLLLPLPRRTVELSRSPPRLASHAALNALQSPFQVTLAVSLPPTTTDAGGINRAPEGEAPSTSRVSSARNLGVGLTGAGSHAERLTFVNLLLEVVKRHPRKVPSLSSSYLPWRWVVQRLKKQHGTEITSLQAMYQARRLSNDWRKSKLYPRTAKRLGPQVLLVLNDIFERLSVAEESTDSNPDAKSDTGRDALASSERRRPHPSAIAPPNATNVEAKGFKMTLLQSVGAERRKRPDLDALSLQLPLEEIARKTNEQEGTNLTGAEAISFMVSAQKDWARIRDDPQSGKELAVRSDEDKPATWSHWLFSKFGFV